MSRELLDWLGGRESLCVVSPHFDDAIYSAFVALTLPGLKRRAVATVITTAPEGKATFWATHTGFADAHVEHLARAAEDVACLGELGIRPAHLGGVSDSTASLPGAIERFADLFLTAPQEWAFLLPAGTGIQVGRVERLFRRILNRPREHMAHPEHMGTRDRMRQRIHHAPGAIWGYYAEHPYLSFDNIRALTRRLRKLETTPLHCVQCNPEPEAKLRSAEAYVSQAKVALGTSREARLLFASRPEVYILREAGA